MGKSLVIVESPAKAKTINKYLGNDFIVKSSVGHIRDLPKAGSVTRDKKQTAQEAVKVRKMDADKKQHYIKERDRKKLFDRMGIDPDKDWLARYEVLDGKQKVVAELKKLAKNADAIYLATDLDREGEAIAWHLQEVVGKNHNYKRVVFNEITQKAIKEAFSKPSTIDYNRVNAQQARRFLDRIVGFMLSPLLWQKVARGLSAGRVQSVAVRILVEREREIKSFIPEEFWILHADLLRDNSTSKVRFEVVRGADGKKYRPANKQASNVAVEALRNAQYSVINREDKPTKSKAPAPYITSTLQQAASAAMGFGVRKTMTLAQRLYEAGHITYMRTDSLNLSEESIQNCRQYIEKNFGDKYLPKTAKQYSSKAGAQEAHEAIRPSNVNVVASTLTAMEPDARRLYQLIWQRFVACQMVDAQFVSTVIDVQAADYHLRAKGRVMKFDGYQKVMPTPTKKEDEQELPDYAVGETLQLQALNPKQLFTKPPARYSEASLVKELEKSGVGRPSTYASIIQTIQDRGYARLENKRFYAAKVAEIVTERLIDSFSDLMDYEFTARMEQQLDDIATGSINWKQSLNNFYNKFLTDLDKAQQDMRHNQPIPIGLSCENCGQPMQIRNASTGVFLGCSGYGLPPKERCKKTMSLSNGDEAINTEADEDSEGFLLRTRKRCKRCNSVMEPWLIDSQYKIHICANNPDCAGYELERGEFKIRGYEGPTLECDKCSNEMQLKDGRFGKYFGCSNSECKNTRKLLRNGQVAPPKMNPVPMPELRCAKVDDYYLLRDGAAGLFLAASQYPKHRETRAPLLAEIRSHKDELDPKYHYLLSGPDTDTDGNDVIVRYSRKTQEIYLRAEQNGKATGWSSYYRNNQWVTSK